MKKTRIILTLLFTLFVVSTSSFAVNKVKADVQEEKERSENKLTEREIELQAMARSLRKPVKLYISDDYIRLQMVQQGTSDIQLQIIGQDGSVYLTEEIPNTEDNYMLYIDCLPNQTKYTIHLSGKGMPRLSGSFSK